VVEQLVTIVRNSLRLNLTKHVPESASECFVTQDLNQLNRRHLLVGSATWAVGATLGCRHEEEPVAAATEERQDVPLRLALAGTEQDAESIQRGWGAVTEQPIDIQPIKMDRGDAGTLSDAILTAAKNSDLIIYPLAWVAQASAAEVVVALSDDEFEAIDQESGSLFPALRSGAARYADQYLAVPLGAALPALLWGVDDAESGQPAIESWQAYDDAVSKVWNGMASEPSAPGWAGAMFLWRAASAKSWLFSREDLRPLVDQEPYIESLDLMVRTHARYQMKRQTPDQVWSAVNSGELKGGIGFPGVRTEVQREFQIGNMPGVNELSKVLLDPFSPVISLSANCRQSTVAKRFIGWISGGEGSPTIRQQVAGMTEIRESANRENDAYAGGPNSYNHWLATRLSSPVTIPNLQLLQAGDYYAALDQHVGRALAGDAKPREALAAVAKQWQATSEHVGIDKQLRAWRRAQGIGV
jgi:hypothetical protein